MLLQMLKLRIVLLVMLLIALIHVEAAPAPLNDVKQSTADFVGDLLAGLSEYVRSECVFFLQVLLKRNFKTLFHKHE